MMERGKKGKNEEIVGVFGGEEMEEGWRGESCVLVYG